MDFDKFMNNFKFFLLSFLPMNKKLLFGIKEIFSLISMKFGIILVFFDNVNALVLASLLTAVEVKKFLFLKVKYKNLRPKYINLLIFA